MKIAAAGKGKHPKVLLLGNGLLRAYGGEAWDTLISEINTRGCTESELRSLPYPLQPILATNDRVDEAMRSKSGKFIASPVRADLMQRIVDLLACGFDCVLTTNYSYEAERSIDSDFLKASHVKKFRRHTAGVPDCEKSFFLYTYYCIPFGKRNVNIWHIHGEAALPDSMVIGHYYYGLLLHRYAAYFEEKADHIRRLSTIGGEALSWLDYFIFGDVYTLGYGFDPAEMDMWWLINRKKREGSAAGITRVYEPCTHLTRARLLEIYGADIIDCGFDSCCGGDFIQFYDRAIADIRSRLITD